MGSAAAAAVDCRSQPQPIGHGSRANGGRLTKRNNSYAKAALRGGPHESQRRLARVSYDVSLARLPYRNAVGQSQAERRREVADDDPQQLSRKPRTCLQSIDPQQVEDIVRDRLRRIDAAAWAELAAKIGRIGFSAFEDYTPGP